MAPELDPPPEAPQTEDAVRVQPRFDHVTWERIHSTRLVVHCRIAGRRESGLRGVCPLRVAPTSTALAQGFAPRVPGR